MRVLLPRLLLLLASLVVAFVIGELILRLQDRRLGAAKGHIGASFPRRLVKVDPRLGYRMQPHRVAVHSTPEFEVTISSSSLGLRDREYAPRAAPGLRIVVFGDSFTFGWGVEGEETFPKRLEQLLNRAAPQRPYEVINAGFTAYSVVQEVRLLEELGPRLDPDIVVLSLSLVNDIVDSRLWVVQDRSGSSPGQQRRGVIERSALLSRLSDRGRSLLRAAGLSEDCCPWDEIGELGIYLHPPPREVQEGYAIARDYLGRFAQIAASLGSVPLVLLNPDKRQFPPYPEFHRLAPWISVSSAELIDHRFDPNRRLTAIAESLGVPVLDLHPAFASAGRSLYYQEDIHWNPAGHALAAQALEQFLRRERFLSPRD